MIAINPQKSWEVEISVPTDHPTGTFWYHAHVHGSTALQVSSGMAGAIIIENPDDPKSLDSLPEIKAAIEQTLLLQQIVYDEQGQIENYDNFGPGAVKYDANDGKTSYHSGSFARTGRLPTINGQIMPEIVMQPGEVRRWRFIHGGIRETFMVGVTDTDSYTYANKDPRGYNKNDNWTMNEMAIDGLALGYINGWKELELQPGYRADVLVQAPLLKKGEKEKVYYLMDLATSKTDSLLQTAEPAKVLAKIVVRGKAKSMKLPCQANKPCPAMANMRPHKNIEDKELAPTPEKVVFNIAPRICKSPGEPCDECDPAKDEDKKKGCKTRFMINEIPFSNNNIRKLTLTLTTASQWLLSSNNAVHPFHIHVKPFQLTRKNPLDKDEIVWRDTVLIEKGKPLAIRSRYERYIGKFVLHCHILDHEDQGMMQIVEIVPPGNPAHH